MRREELPHLRGHGSGGAVIPAVLLIGREECLWPMQVFESAKQALDWVQHAERDYPRHVYRLEVDTGDIAEMEFIPATKPRLEVKR